MNVKDNNTVSADGQLRGDSRVSYLGKSGTKVLIVGNSITRHAPAPEIGWENNCGMAASSEEQDYIHLLYNSLNEKEPYCFMVMQIADFERTFRYKSLDKEELKKIQEFSPDIVVGRLSENVTLEDCKNNAWMQAYGQFLKSCGSATTKYVLTTGFWKSEDVDIQTRKLGIENHWKLVELGDLGDDPVMRAGSKFWHKGVAVHPGDAGMYAIAKRIYQAVMEVKNA